MEYTRSKFLMSDQRSAPRRLNLAQRYGLGSTPAVQTITEARYELCLVTGEYQSVILSELNNAKAGQCPRLSKVEEWR